jgi:tRNA G46 methylase TrmB
MVSSSVPVSSQTGLHPRLDAVVRRHLSNPWRQPIRAHSQRAFDELRATIEAADRVVLDSGCGTGASTARLAQRHPDALVLGIDKSAARLARAPVMPPNARLVRAELADFWRLLNAAGVGVEHHYLLYPNPWPKAAHLKRRWHGHPVFPDLLALGGCLELRANFGLYLREFRRALELVGLDHAKVVSFRTVSNAISAFEAKYLASGHVIERLTINLEETR